MTCVYLLKPRMTTYWFDFLYCEAVFKKPKSKLWLFSDPLASFLGELRATCLPFNLKYITSPKCWILCFSWNHIEKLQLLAKSRKLRRLYHHVCYRATFKQPVMALTESWASPLSNHNWIWLRRAVVSRLIDRSVGGSIGWSRPTKFSFVTQLPVFLSCGEKSSSTIFLQQGWGNFWTRPTGGDR